MKAMILAAGLGTRLRPLTEHLPKPLLPVGDQPLIYYHLALLKKYGLTDIVINVHYHAEKLMFALGDGARFGVHITYSEEPAILGTGGGIKNLQTILGSEPFLVINGDILVDINLELLFAFHQKKKAAATLALRDDPDLTQYGIIEIDNNDRIRNILSKIPSTKKNLRKRMFTGVHIVEPAVFDYIPQKVVYSITDSYIEMLKKEERLFGYPMEGYWNDIGVQKRYHEVNQEMKDGKIKLHYMP
ncbi:MAG: nucleotidyltransferase family protein [Nitrospirae bacterium]|nr:nucleotidyltransferase family protein [Candidatus Troglogloeales bacterium]